MRIALMTIVFLSGACSLAYQAVWLRELRLVFGASTTSTSAVLAMFMGGLGFGSLLLARRAERSTRPLRFYALVELTVAITAAATPAVLWAGHSIYLATGAERSLGLLGATCVRLLLTALVVGVPALAMGGTLPAMVRAFDGDGARRFVGALYGVNALGAVVGAFVPAFVLFELWGFRATLWAFCALNLGLALAAAWLSRLEPAAEPVPPRLPAVGSRLVLVAAFASGAIFFVAEIVWYRLATPLLGGSTYTFALVLSVALAGVGVGAGLFALRRRPPSWRAYALTALLGSAGLALPLVAGDDVARLAETLRGLGTLGFWGTTLGWAVVAALLALPLSVAAGYQLPLLFALAREGAAGAARDVGALVAANTAGAIVGSLVGGFLLLPLVGATGTWRMAVIAWACLALVAPLGRGRVVVVVAAAAIVLLSATQAGPGALWRHGGIGVGRGEDPEDRLSDLQRRAALEILVTDERDGREAATAILLGAGPSILVGGKSDGNVALDSITQVGSALVPALIHGAPARAFVIGLGTGQTAGWLAEIESVTHVEVAEIEPEVVEFARRVSASSFNATDRPDVEIRIGDGRELLLTSPLRYDLILSEPSNPYRAGVASFYTREFYAAARERLNEGGIFGQWVQGYEVEPAAIALVLSTLRSVFDEVTIWTLESGDLLFCARAKRGPPVDQRRVIAQLQEHPFALGFTRALGLPSTLDAFEARRVAGPEYADALAARLPGWLNTDDRPLLEFSYARTIGARQRHAAVEVLRDAVDDPVPLTLRSFTHRDKPLPFLSARLEDAPEIRMARALAGGDRARALEAARSLTVHPSDRSLHLRAGALYATLSDPDEYEHALLHLDGADRASLRLLRALHQRSEVKAAALELAAALAVDPWAHPQVTGAALSQLALAPLDDEDAHALAGVLAAGPFAALVFEDQRISLARQLASQGAPLAACVALETIALEGQARLEQSALARRRRCFAAHAPARLHEVEAAERVLELETTAPFSAFAP